MLSVKIGLCFIFMTFMLLLIECIIFISFYRLHPYHCKKIFFLCASNIDKGLYENTLFCHSVGCVYMCAHMYYNERAYSLSFSLLFIVIYMNFTLKKTWPTKRAIWIQNWVFFTWLTFNLSPIDSRESTKWNTEYCIYIVLFTKSKCYSLIDKNFTSEWNYD